MHRVQPACVWHPGIEYTTTIHKDRTNKEQTVLEARAIFLRAESDMRPSKSQRKLVELMSAATFQSPSEVNLVGADGASEPVEILGGRS